MSAPLIIALLLGGGLLALAAARWRRVASWVALLFLAAALVPAAAAMLGAGEGWLSRGRWPWIPRFGITLHFGIDGLSGVLILLTLSLGIVAVIASWREIERRVGFFHFNLLWTLAGAVGVFAALDLFLFFFFWELMLVPMAFLIAIWGHEHRVFAAIKFFIFTQASGLLMLAAILALALLHYRNSGILTFDYLALREAALEPEAARWLFWGFFLAFAVKLPAIPLHTWLPDAHTEAPTAGSVILAGVLLKTGAYGLLRFAVPLFPGAAAEAAPLAMAGGALGVLYGALLAFAQDDIKRLVAYTSVSHMGFVLLGIFAGNEVALQGVVMQMVAHGVSTGALFVLVGALQERLHTRDLRRFSGVWGDAPRLAAIGLFFAVASLGLPGFGNFVGEFLVLLGSFRVSVPWTAVAALGLVLAVIYALTLVQRAFFGRPLLPRAIVDVGLREGAVLGLLMLAILWLGLYPQPLLQAAGPALAQLTPLAGGGE